MKYVQSYFLFVLFLLTPSLPLKSQDFWEQLYFPDSTAIYCIAVNDQENIFVGAAYDGVSGGVYRSMDTAQTWELVLDLGEFSINSIAIDENGYVYAASSSTEYQSGLYRSTNNGQNWENIEPDIGVYGNILDIKLKGDTIFVSIWSNTAVLLRSTDNGVSWEISFQSDNSNEYVSDVAISSIGDIYLSLMCFFPSMGGIYKSEDGGETWEYAGLINHQIYSVEFNSNDDLFIGVWSDFINATGGLYAIYNGSDTIEELLFGPSVTEMVINSDDDIYFADVPGGIIRSQDNGQTFEYVNEGLSGEVGRMSIDNQGFIYLASMYSSSRLAKSIDPTITGLETEPLIYLSHNFRIIPNPAKYYINLMIPNEFVSSKSCTLLIYNISGILIYCENLMSWENKFQMDISNFMPGIYSLKVFNENSSMTAKFIKK